MPPVVLEVEKDLIQFIAKITDHVRKNKCSKQTHSKTAPKILGWLATSSASCIWPRYSQSYFRMQKMPISFEKVSFIKYSLSKTRLFNQQHSEMR
jgi:hypothetical protein